MAGEYTIFEDMTLAGKISDEGRLKIVTVDPTELTASDKDEVFNCGLEHLLCSPQHTKLYSEALKVLEKGDTLKKEDVEKIAALIAKENYPEALEKLIPSIKPGDIFRQAKVKDVGSCDTLLQMILKQWKTKTYSIEKWLKSIDLILRYSKDEKNFPKSPLGILFQFVNPNVQSIGDIHEAALLLEVLIKHFPDLSETTESNGWTTPVRCMYKQNATMVLACFDDKCKLPYDINNKIKSLCAYGDMRVQQGTLLMGTFNFFKNKSLLLTLLRQMLTNPKLDINVQDALGNTAAVYAGISLDPQAFQMIINHKDFDLSLKNNLGETLEDALKHKDIFYYNPDLSQIFIDAMKNKDKTKKEKKQGDSKETKISELLQPIIDNVEEDETLEDDEKKYLMSTISFLETQFEFIRGAKN